MPESARGIVSRIHSVEVFRLLAAGAVVVLHCTPFERDLSTTPRSFGLVNTAIEQLCRFAVPFFFIVSGYFWGAKLRSPADALPRAHAAARRVMWTWVLWNIVYLLPYNLSLFFSDGLFGPIRFAYWRVLTHLHVPAELVWEGIVTHLWFLVALATCFYIAAVFVRQRWDALLAVLAVGLYGVGLLGKSYSAGSWGFDWTFDTRNGPFFGLLPFVTGYFLSKRERSLQWANLGVVVWGCGLALQVFELRYLTATYGISWRQDYVVGTYFMGLGAALVALSGHRALALAWLARFGPLSQGIYAAHMLFIDLLEPIDLATDHAAWEMSHGMLVFGLSLAVFLVKQRFIDRDPKPPVPAT